jgi:threonine synthase
MGGIIAREMGLPVKQFVIATNENDEVPEFLKTGNYNPIIPSRNCISSAMNVGQPSNLARVVALYGGTMDNSGKLTTEPDLSKMREDFFAASISDKETKTTIVEVLKRYNILLEPHGAVAWKGLKEYLSVNGIQGKPLCISLETAHPSKFGEELEKILNFLPSLPASLAGLEQLPEYFAPMENSYGPLKDFILKHNK